MKKYLLILIILLFATPSYAQFDDGSKLVYQKGAVFEAILLSNSEPVGFTVSNISSSYPVTNRAVFSVENNDVRVKWDGSNCTVGEGLVVKKDTSFEIIGYHNILNFRVCAKPATSLVNVMFETVDNLLD